MYICRIINHTTMKTEKEIQDMTEKLFKDADSNHSKPGDTLDQRHDRIDTLKRINAQVNILNWVLYGTKIKN